MTSSFNLDSGTVDNVYQPGPNDPSSGTDGVAEIDDAIILGLEAVQAGAIDLLGRLQAVPWTATTYYKAKQLVITPVGAYTAGVTSLVQCATAHTSGTTFAGADWTHLADVATASSGTLNGVTVSGTPAAGQVLTATSSTAADWQASGTGVVLDTAAADIQPLGTQAAGSEGKAADSKHVHPTTGVLGMPLALTGATAATRYVGATTSGAPSTGSFATGDFVIDQSGAVWICTVGGSPGTWANPAASSNPSLSHMGGVLSSYIGIASPNTATIFSPNLAVGTWLLNVGCSMENGSTAGGQYSLQVSGGTATYSLTGQTMTQFYIDTVGDYQQVFMQTIVTVTAGGTVLVTATANTSALYVGNGSVGLAGWTAVRIG